MALMLTPLRGDSVPKMLGGVCFPVETQEDCGVGALGAHNPVDLHSAHL